MPRFSFFISPFKEPVTEASPIWHQPIPVRFDTLVKSEGNGNGEALRHAAYFRGAQAFIVNNGFEMMTRALCCRLNREVNASDIEEIRICLEKHGEFYHPARVEVAVFKRQFRFVLNVAVSKTGRRFIEKEYHLLNRLNAESDLGYLPQAYGFGRIVEPDGQDLAMFLGEWFDGYHEFHTSVDPVDKHPKIMVWDNARGRFFLSAGQTQMLYAQASHILTAYYNLESFEQIFSWHHAAGDFIVKTQEEKLKLKLVTVRRYESIFEDPDNSPAESGDPQLILQALLIFFLNLSIRMRLDRTDGIGELVWSDSIAVEATLTGFLEALSMKPAVRALPDSPLACFIAYLASCSQTDLMDLAETIVGRLNPRMPGLAVVKKNLNAHVATLHNAVRQILLISTT